MMRKKRELKNLYGHPLKSKKKLLQTNKFSCTTCSQRKVDNKTITRKIRNESISFSKRIQGDIYGPIHPSCGSFRYFMILINESIIWSHICLLSTRNQAIAKLLAKLRVHFPDYSIKKIFFDNIGEITSHTVHEYCILIGIPSSTCSYSKIDLWNHY